VYTSAFSVYDNEANSGALTWDCWKGKQCE